MKILMTAVTAAFVLAAGALTASASPELDKAMGSASFIHPTGPVHGVWGSNEGTYQDKH